MLLCSVLKARSRSDWKTHPLKDCEYTEGPAESGDRSEFGQETLATSGKNVGLVITSEQDNKAPALNFPVVALGASAGGLDAFTRVLQNLPPKTGMAFLLIQHLAPHHTSQLT